MTPFSLLACLVLICISAYMSSAEIALFSLSRFQIRSMKETFGSGHRKIKKLLSDPGGLLVTILVVNEVVNIALAAIITEAVSRHSFSGFLGRFPSWAVNTFLGLIITTPIALILCDATPKVIGAKANRLVATLGIGPLHFIYDIFKPIRSILTFIVNSVSTGRFHSSKSSEKEQPMLKESEFLMMVEEGKKEGAIEESEYELIQNVFELDDTTVAQVYTPMNQAQVVTATATLKDVLISMRNERHSRIPVVTSNRKKVVGILYTKDLLRAKLDPSNMSMPVEEVMRKPFTVAPTTRLNALFRKLKQQKTHMAIVQSQTGESIGIVTMTDVLEALFGEMLPDEVDL
jgi:CBS domain containing-hemolysin-like protein